jgi:hypothetical protein
LATFFLGGVLALSPEKEVTLEAFEDALSEKDTDAKSKHVADGHAEPNDQQHPEVGREGATIPAVEHAGGHPYDEGVFAALSRKLGARHWSGANG